MTQDKILNPGLQQLSSIPIELLPHTTGIPLKFKGIGFKALKVFDDFTPDQKISFEKIIYCAKIFTKRKTKTKVLCLNGKNGNGKSHLACAIAQNYYPKIVKSLVAKKKPKDDFLPMERKYRLCHQKSRVIHFDGGRFLNLMNSYAINGKVKEEEIEKIIRQFDLIILDDIPDDILIKSDAKINTLFSLIHQIYNQEKCKLIMTFNFHASKFERINEALFSRLLEIAESFEFNFPDRRHPKNKKD